MKKIKVSSKIWMCFKDDCSKDAALQAWYGFFNHDYWSKQVATQRFSVATVQKSVDDYYQSCTQRKDIA